MAAFITESDLRVRPNQVMASNSIEIFNDKPTVGLLAGVYLPDGDGPNKGMLIKAEFHFGLNSWVLSMEHITQKANTYRKGKIQETIVWFEEFTGRPLQEILVIDLGVGVYSAKTQKLRHNPFELVHGEWYRITSRLDGIRKYRDFLVDVQNGKTLITFKGKKSETPQSYAPDTVLSA